MDAVMLITYLDDSGNVGSSDEQHYILAGISIFERQTVYLDRALDRIVQETGLAENPRDLELHGNVIHARRGAWRKLQNRTEARSLILSALCATRHVMDSRLFGVVINKQRCPKAEHPAEYAFEQLCSRFDHYLSRREKEGDRHSGILVLDESTRKTRLQELSVQFRRDGNRWGERLRHFAEVPLFVDSKATRLVQYADLVCYALWRKYEHNDSEFFDIIRDQFDSEEGEPHGLVYYPPD